MKRVILEPAARAVCKENSVCPLIFQLPPERGRAALEKAQEGPVCAYPACISTTMLDTGRWGEIPVHLIRPEQLQPGAGVIFYIHGAGWVFGSLHTHEKLVRELAARTGCLVVFPEYSRSPEARYPTAVEQCYCALEALPRLVECLEVWLDLSTLTVAGDSVGGNTAIAMTLLAKTRGGPKIHKQLLYYPVTDARFDTGSYREYANGFYLYRAGMIWFWNQYAPSRADRAQITASPLRAGLSQLCGLPPAMIINAEADVLRDEGEAYADKLRQAGVDVTHLRIRGMIHDFVMLNALDQTQGCRAAMDASTEWLCRKNWEANCR